MSTGDYTAVRQGTINQAGDPLALFLKVFCGEVLTTFALECVTMDKFRTRSITSGKTAQFPVLGSLVAGYHTAGLQIQGQNTNQNEKNISIDSLLLSSFFLDNLDDAMAHYDVRQPYSVENGRALARQYDKNVFQTTILAARTSTGNLTSDALSFGGTQIVDANAATVADNLAADILTAAQRLDEKNVPTEDRNCFLRPAYYYLLLNSSKAIHFDYNKDSVPGGYASGKIYQVGGIPLVKSNNVPNANISAITGENNTYAVNAVHTVAVIGHKEAVGTVKLLDIATESEYLIANQGWLTVSKMAVGHGVLRPECAVEIVTA